MRKFVAEGEGTNLKTNKTIQFQIPDSISKLGIENFIKNVTPKRPVRRGEEFIFTLEMKKIVHKMEAAETEVKSNDSIVHRILEHGVLIYFVEKGRLIGPRPRINDVKLVEGKSELDLVNFLVKKLGKDLSSIDIPQLAKALCEAEKKKIIIMKFREFGTDLVPLTLLFRDVLDFL